MAIEVIKPGLATSVQDAGRPGYYNIGIPISGGLDQYSLRAANLLVGNDEGAAVECGRDVLVHDSPSRVRGGVDCLADLLEGPASANIGDGLVNVHVGRLRFLLQERRHRHDHAALAIAALRNVVGDPGLLHFVQCAIVGEAFDGGDLLAGGFADREAAGTHCDPIDMDRAGPALCNAATVFSSG